MPEIKRPKLAYSAQRIAGNGVYTAAIGRTIQIANRQDLEHRLHGEGRSEEEAKKESEEIIEATEALNHLMGRPLITSDLYYVAKMGFASIKIKAERAYEAELKKNKVGYDFDSGTNIFTILDRSSE